MAVYHPTAARRARREMALAALSGDEQLVIFVELCNVLDPGVAVAFSSTNSELWELTQAPRQQLQADHEAAAALGRKEIGRAHVLTPVTSLSRMPSSA